MKKSIITLSMVALFTVAANAQEMQVKRAEPKKTNKEKAIVKSDGTSATTTGEKKTEAAPVKSTGNAGTTTTGEKKTEVAPVKSGGTRMAINEKGLPGSSKNSKKEPEKATASPGQPGASGK